MATEIGLAYCVQSSGDQIVAKKLNDTRQVHLVKTVLHFLNAKRKRRAMSDRDLPRKRIGCGFAAQGNLILQKPSRSSFQRLIAHFLPRVVSIGNFNSEIFWQQVIDFLCVRQGIGLK